ncbi:hypothetical protein AGMMS49949_05900 [Alphaproteobacteria bacterium]|nr:hypothetical protein AGMMS49949_05900 [Alphaproteobacteria bacterium]GHT00369.1 hypothetical protein AGMMS50296_8660 [Alphaproteobacteria bacterium]
MTSPEISENLIDSHCHLEMFCDLDLVMQRALDQGISHMVTIGTTLGDFSTLSNICKRFDGYVWMTVGIHPDYAETTPLDKVEAYFRDLPDCSHLIGVGEIGLDYLNFHDKTVKNQQKQLFDFQLQWAEDHNLPVVIHTRMAFQDTLDIVRTHPRTRGVFHCFGEDKEAARQVLDCRYILSFSGIVTFKNAKSVQEVARFVPDNQFLVETDAPFLAPTPHRGERNEPAFVRLTAEFVAQLRGVSIETLCEQTVQNFENLFGVNLLEN